MNDEILNDFIISYKIKNDEIDLKMGNGKTKKLAYDINKEKEIINWMTQFDIQKIIDIYLNKKEEYSQKIGDFSKRSFWAHYTVGYVTFILFLFNVNPNIILNLMRFEILNIGFFLSVLTYYKFKKNRYDSLAKDLIKKELILENITELNNNLTNENVLMNLEQNTLENIVELNSKNERLDVNNSSFLSLEDLMKIKDNLIREKEMSEYLIKDKKLEKTL